MRLIKYKDNGVYNHIAYIQNFYSGESALCVKGIGTTPEGAEESFHEALKYFIVKLMDLRDEEC